MIVNKKGVNELLGELIEYEKLSEAYSLLLKAFEEDSKLTDEEKLEILKEVPLNKEINR